MAKPELRSLAQARRELVQTMLALEPSQRLQLRVSSSARADELRLGSVRAPVWIGLDPPYGRPPVDLERSVAGAREGERLRNPLEPLCVCDRVIPALEHAECDVLVRDRLGDE